MVLDLVFLHHFIFVRLYHLFDSLNFVLLHLFYSKHLLQSLNLGSNESST